MRTTVTLSDDVAGAVKRLREERGVGVSEAVNELIRQGLAAPATRRTFEQRTHAMHARMDLTNVWEAIETAEGPAAR